MSDKGDSSREEDIPKLEIFDDFHKSEISHWKSHWKGIGRRQLHLLNCCLLKNISISNRILKVRSKDSFI